MCKVGSRIAITLTLVALTWTVSSQQVKRSIGSDAPRIQRAAPADATTLATRQRFLEMFARAYFPGRTGQLLIVPREGDFITRPDVAYMHGSPWTYDVAIPLMFAGPAVRTGRYSTPADGCNIPYRCRERCNWTSSQEMPGNLQKEPPVRQISLAAWTRTPAGIKGFAWRILPPGRLIPFG